MSARCASCRYPVCVSDSVACHECRSHFHVNCACFPYHELSPDPSRNTFQCRTCQVLPLCQGESDQCDSDDEEAGMPSRQHDLEGQMDFVRDMHELKGTVQDISDLCKDMLREINELKSVNLTLRCGIENLRHDNKERDGVIADLKRRLDILEGKHVFLENTNASSYASSGQYSVSTTAQYIVEEETTKTTSYGSNVKKGENEQNHGEDSLTLYIEEDVQDVGSENDSSITNEECESKSNISYWSSSGTQQNHISQWSKNIGNEKIISEQYEAKESIDNTEKILLNNNEYEAENLSSEVDNDIKEHIDDHEIDDQSETETIPESEESVRTFELQSKEKTEVREGTSKCEAYEEWGLKSNEAIEIDNTEEESDAEDEGNEGVVELAETQSCLVDEELEKTSKLEEKHVHFWNVKEEEESDEEDDEEEEGSFWELSETITSKDVRKEIIVGEGKVLKKEQASLYKSKKEPEDQTEEENSCAEEIITEPQPTEEENETLPENFTTEEGESRLDAVEKWVEENQRVNSEDTQEEEDRRLEEGGLATEGESRLDGDAAATTEEQGPEERAEYEPLSEAERRELGENLTEGQSPEEGEVQPEEDAPTRDVIRNEEDVWRFLKESVSSTHPSTVHQFVQELIETLQHVPQEYLKPVVEANIKRATTPSVTDSEHLRDGALTPHEGDRHGSELAVEEPEGLREDAGVEDAVVTLSNDLQLHSSRADLTASNEELKSGPTEDSGRGYPYIEAAD